MDLKLFAFFATIFFVSLLGFVAGYLMHYVRNNRAQGRLEEHLSRMKISAQDEVAELKAQANREVEAIRTAIEKRQQKIDARESKIDSRQERLDEFENRNHALSQELELREGRLDEAEKKLTTALEKVAGLTHLEAENRLLEEVESQVKEKLERRSHLLEQEGEELLDTKARNILATAIQRYGNSIENDMVATSVAINDEEKGKIIGKEGRNIKAFEQASGVQLVVDDTPGQITVSSFDPIRRVIAKTALDALLKDGRIQPARIEEAVAQAQTDVDDIILKQGKKAAQECNVPGLDKELLHIVGRLYFRYSYGQNVLQHSIEMAHIANIIATELGADAYVARAGALLHDIGKAVDHEVEGTHVEIGRRILNKYGVGEAVVKAMEAHHEEYPYETVESRIVQTADAISSARPGARSDNAELFIQKMQDLERIARSVEGVNDAYAIAAGRELRIFVNPDEVNDYAARTMAQKIAHEVERELTYPGEIKVVVIREQRSIEYAH